jgi:hypothetical protein
MKKPRRPGGDHCGLRFSECERETTTGTLQDQPWRDARIATIGVRLQGSARRASVGGLRCATFSVRRMHELGEDTEASPVQFHKARGAAGELECGEGGRTEARAFTRQGRGRALPMDRRRCRIRPGLHHKTGCTHTSPQRQAKRNGHLPRHSRAGGRVPPIHYRRNRTHRHPGASRLPRARVSIWRDRWCARLCVQAACPKCSQITLIASKAVRHTVERGSTHLSKLVRHSVERRSLSVEGGWVWCATSFDVPIQTKAINQRPASSALTRALQGRVSARTIEVRWQCVRIANASLVPRGPRKWNRRP